MRSSSSTSPTKSAISVRRGVENSSGNRGELVLDDGQHPGTRAQDVEIIGNLPAQLVQLVGNLVAAEGGEALQAQVENGARLLFGEMIGAVLGQHMAGIGDEADEGRHVARRPGPRHQFGARGGGVGRGADEADHLVDIGHRDGESHQHVGAIARLVEQELGASGHHLLAEGDEGLQQVLQVQHLRPAADERHVVDAERGLQRREAVELVEHHVGHGVALDLDHHAHALAVGFIADVGDALDALFAHQIGDALDHGRLVHLIGDLGDDDGFAVLAHLLDGDLAAHDDGAAPGMEGLLDAGAAEDDAAGGEIGARDDVDQFVDRDGRVVDDGDAGGDRLAQVVRRHVGRHADGDAAGAVDQQIGQARRQDRGLAL